MNELAVDPAVIVDTVVTMAVTYGPRLIGAILIVATGHVLVRWMRRWMCVSFERSGTEPTLSRFLTSLATILARVAIYLVALGTLGIQTTSFVAILGAAGLAVGLALKGTLSNFAAGVIIILFRPFRVGDFVDVAGVSGTVKQIGIFHTLLDTPDNRHIIVPNGSITDSNIVNHTKHDTRRIDLVIGIGYDDDIRVAKTALEELLATNERVLKEPAPSVELAELADSSINFNVRPWVRTPDYWSVRAELLEKIKIKFDELGISIPYPQRDVHLYRADA